MKRYRLRYWDDDWNCYAYITVTMKKEHKEWDVIWKDDIRYEVIEVLDQTSFYMIYEPCSTACSM